MSGVRAFAARVVSPACINDPLPPFWVACRRQGTTHGEGSNPTNGNSSGNGYSVKDSNTGTNTGTNGHTAGNGHGYSCGESCNWLFLAILDVFDLLK